MWLEIGRICFCFIGERAQYNQDYGGVLSKKLNILCSLREHLQALCSLKEVAYSNDLLAQTERLRTLECNRKDVYLLATY